MICNVCRVSVSILVLNLKVSVLVLKLRILVLKHGVLYWSVGLLSLGLDLGLETLSLESGSVGADICTLQSCSRHHCQLSQNDIPVLAYLGAC